MMIALAGGNEFRRECDAMDTVLMQRAGGEGARVAILPTAATNENPYVAGENGRRHFRRLGAASEKLMIVDDATANHAELVWTLTKYRLIYLAGGDPMYLLETLSGSQTLQAMLSAAEQGSLIAGSGAGAMALGGQMWRFDGWTAGLGLAPSVAVLPHHATLSHRWDAAHMAATLPEGVSLVGIDNATALLLPDGLVVGVGDVTLYGPDGPQAYPAGAQVPLQGLLS
jgi:cyanophycinase-like exopeptidase